MSASVQEAARKLKVLFSSSPDVGFTENTPGTGGALVTITMVELPGAEEEVDVHVNVNVRMELEGSVLAGNIKLEYAVDPDAVAVVGVYCDTGLTNDRALRSKLVSLTDQLS